MNPDGPGTSREERVLRERAERFRRPLESAAAAARAADYLVFRNGGRTYAIEPSGVGEAYRPEAILPLMGAAGPIKGVFARRGGMVAVLDLPGLIGDLAAAGGPEAAACILVLEAGEARLGIEAMGLSRTRIDPDSIKPLSGSGLRHIAGIGPAGEFVLPPGPVLIRLALEESSGPSPHPESRSERLKDRP